MALELLDEHEQGEVVRAWLRDNIGWILLGIVVGLGGIIGWWRWQAYQRDSQEAAQIAYAELIDAVERKDAKAIDEGVDKLRAEYGRTSYAALAEMVRAQEAVKANDTAKAEASLQWVRDNAKVDEIAMVATLRLAQLKLAAGQAQAALDLLGDKADEELQQGFKAQIADMRGDAFAALSRPADARTAYEEALGTLDAMSPQRQFIEWKRDELPLAAAATPAAVPAAPAAAPAAAPVAPPASTAPADTAKTDAQGQS